MLNIQIDYDTKLTSDDSGLNVRIEERTYKKDEFDIEEPTDNFKVVGYYGNVPAAVKGLIKRGLNNSEATNLEQLISDMEAIEFRVLEAVKKYAQNVSQAHMLDSKA